MIGALSVFITCAVYVGSRAVYRKTKILLLHPIITCVAVVGALLVGMHVRYDSYMTGGQWLSFFLQPATVAFAVPLYRYRALLRIHGLRIGLGLLAGTLVAITSSYGLARWFGLGRSIALSIAPRSVTTPIAMDVAKVIGGDPIVTAVFVIVTGVTGALVGPAIAKYLHFHSTIAKGMMLGMGAHGIGTARAYEIGVEEGTVASVSMVVAGCLTVVIAPLLVHLFP